MPNDRLIDGLGRLVFVDVGEEYSGARSGVLGGRAAGVGRLVFVDVGEERSGALDEVLGAELSVLTKNAMKYSLGMLLGSAVSSSSTLVKYVKHKLRKHTASPTKKATTQDIAGRETVGRNPGVLLVVWWSEMCVSRRCESAKRCLRFASRPFGRQILPRAGPWLSRVSPPLAVLYTFVRHKFLRRKSQKKMK